MGSRHLRLGLLWTTLGLGAAVGARELDVASLAAPFGSRIALAAALIAVAVPLALFLAGLRDLVLTGRALFRARAAESLARVLRAKLGDEYVVIPRYRPRDDSDHEVGLVVVGPPGIVVIEARADRGELVCYQDHWFRRTGAHTQRIDDSPSKRARWNATRVRNDVAVGGFIRTPVDAIVVFTAGRVSEASSSSVPVMEGVDQVLAYLQRAEPRTEASPQRRRALTQALGAI
jgi:hypothetical protein